MLTLTIPAEFLTTTYDPSRTPGVANQSDLALGANCQVFAYELLRVNGLDLPNFRSSELWEDSLHTQHVTNLQPLDLVLYNNTPDPFGAHIGVCLDDHKVIHLSAERTVYEIVEHTTLMTRPKYALCIGAKRVIKEKLTESR